MRAIWLTDIHLEFLGNHDFYDGSISTLRQAVEAMSKDSPLLHRLSDCEPVRLNAATCQVGHDGWEGCASRGQPITMRRHPHKRMTVLCDHMHGGGRSQILPNPVTLTGSARYGHPAVQEIFEWT